MNKIILYRLTLSERDNGHWALILRMGKKTKITEFLTLDIAMKNFNRALEFRNMVNDLDNLSELLKRMEK